MGLAEDNVRRGGCLSESLQALFDEQKDVFRMIITFIPKLARSIVAHVIVKLDTPSLPNRCNNKVG
jgi:hypothetical protein